MAAKKLDAQQVCDILNENAHVTGFCESLRGRVQVTKEVAKYSDVMCSQLKVCDGFDSSPLGFINMLVDDPICIAITDDENETPTETCGVMFKPLSKTKLK